MRLAFLALAFVGCQHIPRVGYVEVTPYAGNGSIARVGQSPRADSEHYGVMVTLGFQLDDRNEKQAWANLANLEVDRHGRLTMAPEPAVSPGGPAVIVTPGGGTGPDSGSDGFPVKEIVAGLGALSLTFLTWLRMRVTGSADSDNQE